MAPEPNQAERPPTLDLRTAQVETDRLCELLRPAVEGIDTAGWIRRNERRGKSIDLVAIPRALPDLIGQPAGSALDARLAELVEAGTLRRGTRCGERFQEYELPTLGGPPVRVSITPADRWGLIITLRTGPAGFNKWLSKRLAASGYRIDGGQLWRHGEAVPLRRERDLFRLLGRWIPPQRRFAVGLGDEARAAPRTGARAR